MDSIYQLKTGEFVDLNSIVKVGNIVDDIEQNTRFYFLIHFNHSGEPDKIVVPTSLYRNRIKTAHDKFAKYLAKSLDGKHNIIDRRTIDDACAAGLAEYKKISEEVRDDLIKAWKQYKEET
jgi:hypothetical protein